MQSGEVIRNVLRPDQKKVTQFIYNLSMHLYMFPDKKNVHKTNRHLRKFENFSYKSRQEINKDRLLMRAK